MASQIRYLLEYFQSDRSLAGQHVRMIEPDQQQQQQQQHTDDRENDHVTWENNETDEHDNKMTTTMKTTMETTMDEWMNWYFIAV